MRYGTLILAATAAFMVVSLGSGQERGGFGGLGGAPSDPVSLLRNPSVKKELGLSDEQFAKVPDAVLKALSEVLDEKQMKRLRQIELQQRGTRALADAKVQKELKISDEQRGNIKTILEDSGKEIGELFKSAKGGDFQGMREKMTALRKETNEKIEKVLTSDQRKAWKQLLGEEFKLERPGFGPGGGGDFKKKRKSDVE